MLYVLKYHPKVRSEDIPEISFADKEMILRAIEHRLVIDPAKYGLPLKWGLKGYRKLRVGNYRVIYYIFKDEIRIIIIGHRKDVYKKVNKRL